MAPSDPENSALIRLFIGIAPDAAMQRFLDATVAHCRRLAVPRKLRWLSHGNRHLTLAFLGETPETQLPLIEALLSGIAHCTAPLQGTIVSTHPFPKSRSKLLAAELLPNPALMTLHARCGDLMRQIGKQPEGTTFRPHFTLARSRGGFSRLPPLQTEHQCNLDNIVLYQSLLAPGGSQYQPLLRFPLDG